MSNSEKTTFDVKEIYHQLDNPISPYWMYPDFNDGYFYTSSSRINLFADNNRWSIVFEQTGYHNRNNDISIILYYFGNCLVNLERVGLNDKFESNSKVIGLVSNQKMKELEKKNELVLPTKKTISVRNETLKIEHNKFKYENINIHVNKFQNKNGLIDFVSLTRYLDYYNPKLFQASDEELKQCLPKDLPKIMVIREWHHKEYYMLNKAMIGDKPSSYETFQLISKILISKDTTLYKPKLKPNNDWRNWLDAGNL